MLPVEHWVKEGRIVLLFCVSFPSSLKCKTFQDWHSVLWRIYTACVELVILRKLPRPLSFSLSKGTCSYFCWSGHATMWSLVPSRSRSPQNQGLTHLCNAHEPGAWHTFWITLPDPKPHFCHSTSQEYVTQGNPPATAFCGHLSGAPLLSCFFSGYSFVISFAKSSLSFS